MEHESQGVEAEARDSERMLVPIPEVAELALVGEESNGSNCGNLHGVEEGKSLRHIGEDGRAHKRGPVQGEEIAVMIECATNEEWLQIDAGTIVMVQDDTAGDIGVNEAFRA